MAHKQLMVALSMIAAASPVIGVTNEVARRLPRRRDLTPDIAFVSKPLPVAGLKKSFAGLDKSGPTMKSTSMKNGPRKASAS